VVERLSPPAAADPWQRGNCYSPRSGFILSVMEEISVAGSRGCAIEARASDLCTSVWFFLSLDLHDR
jgi:hypothetical protein